MLYSSNVWNSSIVKLDPNTGQTRESMTHTKNSRRYGAQKGRVIIKDLDAGGREAGLI